MSFKVYLKKLTTQELGYRKGRLMTGQYFYISKAVIGPFFKELDKYKLNDHLSLIFNDPFEAGKKIHATFVYHNDKFALCNGTRNEYRIYLNREIAKHDLHFQPSDIVAIIKTHDNSLDIRLFRKKDGKYLRLSYFINRSNIRGNHALIEQQEFEIAVADQFLSSS